jgi:hypothetical protein
MKTINELKSNLTELEFEMLESIVSYYSFDDNVCYQEKLTASQKGIIGSLVKKQLVYDSFNDMHNELGYENSNFFPSDLVLDIYGLQHY